MKHTKGPWKIDDNAQIIAGKSVLGRVYSGDIFPNDDLEECTANGYLIAASPELLEVCEEMLKAFTDAPPDWLMTKEVQICALRMNEILNKVRQTKHEEK